MRLLQKSSFRYLLRHPWHLWLSVFGIALGVSVIVAIDLANQSVTGAFSVSMNTVAGKATHQIVSASGRIPDSLYTKLRVENGIKQIAPVIEQYVRLDSSNGSIYRLIGLDIFAERDFRDYLEFGSSKVEGDLSSFLTGGNAILIAERMSLDKGLRIGDTIRVHINGVEQICYVTGIIRGDPKDVSLENTIIADISTAQRLTASYGYISYINVIAENPDVTGGLLPDGIYMQRSGARSETAEQMLDAFSINLTALSLLAVIVGIFLIYNTMSFSVVRRRQDFAILRCIGVGRSEIFRLILSETILIGVTGTILGLAAGSLISLYLVKLVTGTINDLYFVVSVPGVYIDPVILLKGAAIGVISAVVSALHPAVTAARTMPSASLLRSTQESDIKGRLKYFSAAGILAASVGGGILALPVNDLRLSYFGILCVLIGFTLLTPSAIVLLVRFILPLAGKLFGLHGKMAAGSITQNLSRTYIAIAALAVAVSAGIGVHTMVGSFRGTVVNWLETRLLADLYISAPTMVSRKIDGTIPENIPGYLAERPYTADINFFREVTIPTQKGEMRVLGVSMGQFSRKTYIFTEGNPEQIWDDFYSGGVFVTEPYSFKNNVSRGMSISIPTDNGIKDFRIAGVYYDYASDEGLVIMDYALLKKMFRVAGVSGVALFLTPGSDAGVIAKEIQGLPLHNQDLLIRTNKYLRESSIEVFDRTFTVAYVLQLLTMITAFGGILSSLMALQLERSRELGVLRAAGFLPGEIYKLLLTQSGIMGGFAALLAVPLGTLLAWILVFVINKRSFGWTLQFDVNIDIYIQSALLAVLAALAAGIYPGYKMSRVSPAEAMRER